MVHVIILIFFSFFVEKSFALIRKFRVILLLFFICPVYCNGLKGQIYAPAAADSFNAAYNPPAGTDEVFIFNKPVYQGGLTASIIALSVDRTTGWIFQWSVYEPISGIYVPLPGIENGYSSSLDTLTISSGYQVEMSKGASIYIFRVWLVFNDFYVGITNKDEENRLLFGYYNCTSLDLRADTSLVPLHYYNPETKSAINIYNIYTIRWKTDNPDASTPASRLITRVNNPPSSDTWYIITLTDRFGLIRKDSVFYESIQSDAKLTAIYIPLGDTTIYPGKDYGYYYDDGVKSAPGKYRFNFSASTNAASFQLNFGDGEVYETDTDTAEVIHEFKLPGNYKVVLTTKSEVPFECPDSVTAEAELAYAGFKLPNVFSPNDDGENDKLIFFDNNNVFRSEDVSIVTIDITIFDRAGRKVHRFAGNIRDWEGWDGKIMNSNREAPEGVYFYAITMLVAYEDHENRIGKDVLKGFFHLYRE
jgi:gliding motility-associated-like protein